MPPVREEKQRISPFTMTPVKQCIYIGVDPGNSGGIAILDSTIGVELFSLKDKTDTEVWEALGMVRYHMRNGMRAHAYLEKVGGYVKADKGSEGGDDDKGGGRANGANMFKFGQSYGMLKAFLLASGIPYEEVRPQDWQKTLGVTPRVKKKKGVAGETKAQFKKRLKQKAQQLFPGQDGINLQVCDALLLAEFNRRKNTGTL